MFWLIMIGVVISKSKFQSNICSDLLFLKKKEDLLNKILYTFINVFLSIKL